MNFPVRHQLESVDCGPTCIQIISAYYKKDIKLSLLKEYCNVTRLGISLKDIIEGSKKIGFNSVATQITINEIKSMPLPAILYWKQDHYVVLYKVKKNKNNNYSYYLVDPGYGKIEIEGDLFIKDWMGNSNQGIAILLEPTEKFFQFPQEKASIKKKFTNLLKPFRYLVKYKQHIFYTLLLLLVAFITSSLIPILLQKIIDKGIATNDMNLIFILLIAQFSLFLGSLLSNVTSNILLFNIGIKVGLKISHDYIYKLVRLPIRFFDTKLGTDLLQRLTDEEKIKNFLTYTLNTILFIILNFIVYSSVLIYYNIFAFLIFLLFTVLSLFSANIVLKKRKQINYALFSNASNKKNIEYELINGMMEIKINKAHDIYLLRWEKIQIIINKLLIKSLYFEYFLNSSASFFNILRDIIITGSCAYLVINGNLTIGIMTTITYLLGQLSGTVNQAINFSKTSQDANLAYARMEEILNVKEENDNKNYILPNTNRREGFLFECVSFKYDGSFNTYVLKDLNIKISDRKVTAIVGASGSGKTTLLKLLLSFYYPQKGDIYLNNIKMNIINADEYRGRCGVVMQDGYIFSGTIANNIALGDEDPDITRLYQSAKIACIDDFIDSLPMKYDTKIGKSGVDMSGGQKQRLLIARAVYKNPDYLFFDEATNALDAKKEQQIMSNLQEFYKGRTVVIVAHRLSTVQHADNIIVLDSGRITERGTHNELTQKKGIYYQLVKNQLELGN